MDVFDGDRRFIHQNTDRQRQAAQRHDVERVAHRAEQAERSQHAQRNRNRDDQGAAPVAQKQKDERRREGRGDQSLTHDAIQRGFDEERLVCEQINL